jgi:Tol biopolymer transport system component
MSPRASALVVVERYEKFLQRWLTPVLLASWATAALALMSAERSGSPRRASLPLAFLLVGLLALPASAGGTRVSGPSGTIAVGGAAVYLISPASGASRRVRIPDRVVDFRLSPDGRRIAVAGLTGVWVMKRDGSAARRIFDGRNVKVGPGHIAWSPSGRRLAFVRAESLFTMRDDGKNVRRVTGHADAPDWWPSGGRIVFVGNPERSSRNGTISAIGTDGRGLHRLVSGGKWYGPRVSPDGSKLAFYRNGFPGIYVAPAKGGKARLLVRNGSQPVWSPDGRYVAFTGDAQCKEGGCTNRVFVVPASGGEPRAYGPPIFDIGSVSWSR